MTSTSQNLCQFNISYRNSKTGVMSWILGRVYHLVRYLALQGGHSRIANVKMIGKAAIDKNNPREKKGKIFYLE